MISGQSPSTRNLSGSFRGSLHLTMSLAVLALPVLSLAATENALKPLDAIEVPGDTPPDFKDPFDIKDRWLDPMTVPAGKERIHSAIVIGDRMKKKWPTVVIAPGSVWTATKSGRVEISGGNVVARQCRFEKLPIEVDHACRYFFLNCSFDDCRFGKAGVWYGGDLAGKYYFENCIIRRKFANPLNLVDTGFRIQTCVFEDIDLPSMNFRGKEPANYVNERWLRIVNCRFVKCTLPISFLLLTRDCVYENCTFIEDAEPMEELKKPIEINLYVKGSKSKIRVYPAYVVLNQLPDTDMKDIRVPTAASLMPDITP
jgi:hypothetical protein